MGRVYDALKRAEGQPRTSISKTSVSHDGNGNGKNRSHAPLTIPDSEIVINEYALRNESPTSIDELGSAFNRSGLARK